MWIHLSDKIPLSHLRDILTRGDDLNNIKLRLYSFSYVDQFSRVKSEVQALTGDNINRREYKLRRIRY